MSRPKLPPGEVCHICKEKSKLRERDNKGYWTGKYVCKEHYGRQYYGDVEEMIITNPGYDFLCRNPRKEFSSKYPQFKLENNKDYKIDSKGPRLLFNNWKDIEQCGFAINKSQLPPPRSAGYDLL